MTVLQISELNLPWFGLSVWELTECSPRCVRCSLCLITFSIFKSVGVVTSVRVMMGEESAESPVTAPPVGVHVLPRMRSKYDSSVWVALSSCSRVAVSRLHAGAGRKYSASSDAVRRIEPSFSVSTFPADKDKLGKIS